MTKDKNKSEKPGKRVPSRQMTPVPIELYEALKELAQEGNRPISRELAQAIKEYLVRKGKLAE
jgi:hypothetical protein